MRKRKPNSRSGRWRATLAFACAVSALAPAGAAAASGPLDRTFGDDGISLVKPPSGYNGEALYALALDGRDRLVAAGATEQGAILVRRYLPNGSPDPSFGAEGRVQTAVGGGAAGHAVAVLPGGDVLVAGGTETGFALVRYHPDGSRATWFGRDGRAVVGGGTNGAAALALGLQRKGRILSGGYKVDLSGDWTGVVLGSRPNGAKDDRFASAGFAELESDPKTEARITGLEALSDGRILVGGDIGGWLMLGRLRANGESDPSFGGGDGLVLVDADGRRGCACSFANALAVDARGRPVLAGFAKGPSGPSALVARFHPDGRLDRAFGANGVVRVRRGAAVRLAGVTIGKGGKITAVGKYEPSSGGAPQIAALRCRPDGELDPSFASRGFFHRRVGIESAGFAAVTEPDGRVLVAGQATVGVPVEFESFSPLKNSQSLLMRFR